MQPRIGQSLGAGFTAAHRSWRAMALVGAAWVLMVALWALLARMTQAPPDVARFAPTAAQAPAPPAPAAGEQPSAAPTPGGPAPAAEATATGQQDAADVFEDLAVAEAPFGEAPELPVEADDLDAFEGVRTEELRRQQEFEAWLGRSWPAFLLFLLVAGAASLWLYAGQVAYLAGVVGGGRPALSVFRQAGSRCFWRVLGAWALGMGVVLLLAAVFVLLTALMTQLAGAIPDWLLDVLSALVLIAYFVGGIWIGIRLLFWPLAIVLEGHGPIGGLGRAWRVNRGHWWRLLGLVAVLALISLGAVLAGGAVGFAAAAAGRVGAVIVNALGFLINLYLGFVGTGAFIRFYQAAAAPAAASQPGSS